MPRVESLKQINLDTKGQILYANRLEAKLGTGH